MKFKPFLRLLIDTREQKPLVFNKKDWGEVKNESLSVGDYACEVVFGQNVTDRVMFPNVIERKSIGDIWGTLMNSKNHERFNREINRAVDENLHITLAIEGSMSDIRSGFEHSSVSGDQMHSTLNTYCVKYGVEIMFCDTRTEMSKFVRDRFHALHRHWEKYEKPAYSNIMGGSYEEV